jgi:hypothetical protein
LHEGGRLDTLNVMSSRLFQLAAGIVLILAALTPVMECFDRWDKNPGPANDTEIYLTAWFVGVGIVLTLAKLLRYIPTFASSHGRGNSIFSVRQALVWVHVDAVAPAASPPDIPLRI